MIIQHNMAAMNAARQYKFVNRKKETRMERLSSGYKINRAGDNAAGLAISEKMRGQIRGLDRASENMEDAVSLVQTADGAMQEISDILQRVRQLSVQAANDTNTDEDRMDIQMEVDSLSQDINRISEQTEFNTIKILKGKKEKTVIVKTPIAIGDLETEESYQTASMPDWVLGTGEAAASTTVTGNLTEDIVSNTVYYRTVMRYDGQTGAWSKYSGQNLVSASQKRDFISGISSYERIDSGNGLYDQVKITYQDGKTETKDLSSISSEISSYLSKNINNKIRYDYEKGGTRAGAYVDFSNLNKDNVFDLINEEYPQAFNSTCCTCQDHYNIAFINGGGNQVTSSGNHRIYSVDISDILERAKAGKEVTGEEVVDKILSALLQNGSQWSDKGEVRPDSHFTVYGKDDTNKNCLIIYDYRKNMTASGNYGKLEWGIYTENGYSNNIKVSESEIVLERTDWLRIQTGANAGQELAMELPEISLEEMGISNLSVISHSDAAFCLDRIDIAINYLNSERARMGAYQNRLEYSISRVDTASENLSASESRIRDTDISEEMVQYTKNNILSQAGESVLANANQNAERVLSLLQ